MLPPRARNSSTVSGLPVITGGLIRSEYGVLSDLVAGGLPGTVIVIDLPLRIGLAVGVAFSTFGLRGLYILSLFFIRLYSAMHSLQ